MNKKIIYLIISIILVILLGSCKKEEYLDTQTKDELEIIYNQYNNKTYSNDLDFPTKLRNGKDVSFESSDTSIVSNEGIIQDLNNGGINLDGSLPQVKFHAKAEDNEITFNVTIKKLSKDATKLLSIIDNYNNLYFIESNGFYDLYKDNKLNIEYEIKSLNSSIIDNKIKVSENVDLNESILIIKIGDCIIEKEFYTGLILNNDIDLLDLLNKEHDEKDNLILKLKVIDIINDKYILNTTNNNYILIDNKNINLIKNEIYIIELSNIRYENNIIVSNISNIYLKLNDNNIINNSYENYNLYTINVESFKKIKLTNQNGLNLINSRIKRNDDSYIIFYIDFNKTYLDDLIYEYIIGYPIIYSNNILFIVSEYKILNNDVTYYTENNKIENESYVISKLTKKSYLIINNDLDIDIIYSNSDEIKISKSIKINNNDILVSDEIVSYSYEDIFNSIDSLLINISNLDELDSDNKFYKYENAYIKQVNDEKIIVEVLNDTDYYNYQVLIDTSYNYNNEIKEDTCLDILLIYLNGKVYFIFK